MGVAALVLGIVSIIIGFVPFCGAIAFIPAIIGLVLGIIDIVQKSKAKAPKGMAIAGTILCAIALIFIIYWIFIFTAVGSAASSFATDEIIRAANEIARNSVNF